MNRLPDSRRALHGRTYGRTWYAADFDPIQSYRGGNGPAWRVFRALVCFGALAAIGLLLAWRG